MKELDRYLRISKVAVMLDVHTQEVYRWIKQGHIEAINLNERCYRIRLSSLQKFLSSREQIE